MIFLRFQTHYMLKIKELSVFIVWLICLLIIEGFTIVVATSTKKHLQIKYVLNFSFLKLKHYLISVIIYGLPCCIYPLSVYFLDFFSDSSCFVSFQCIEGLAWGFPGGYLGVSWGLGGVDPSKAPRCPHWFPSKSSL